MDSAARALELQRMAVMQQQQAASAFKDLERWEDEISLQDKHLQQTAKVLKSSFPVRGGREVSPSVSPSAPAKAASSSSSSSTTTTASSAPKSSAAAAAASSSTSSSLSSSAGGAAAAPALSSPPASSSGVSAEKKKEVRIKTGDYRSWDRLNVDKMLEEMDHEPAPAAPVDGVEALALEEEKERTLREHIANQEKEKGNAQYKQGKYEAAVACYTRGLESDPTNTLLLANRGMAYLALKKYAESEKDCTAALSGDPEYIKAYIRRAAARAGLGNHADSIADLKQVLKREPGNAEAQKDLEKQRKLLEAKEAEQRAKFNPIKALEQQQRAMRRVPIVEVGEPRKTAPAATSTTATTTSTTTATTAAAAATTSSASTASTPASKAGVANPAASRTTTASAASTTTTTTSSTSPATSTTAPTVIRFAVSDPASVTTAAQFERQWRQLQLNNNPQETYAFVKGLNTSHYATLFKNNLENGLLSELVALFRDRFLPAGDDVIPMLKALTAVPRFETAVMFLEDAEKKTIKDVFDALPAADEATVSALRKRFGVS